MATFASEFPDFPATDWPGLPAGFADGSWHNDACPCMDSTIYNLTIWVDYADPAEREVNRKRFTVTPRVPPNLRGNAVLETDDWSEVLALVQQYQTRRNCAELADAFGRMEGAASMIEAALNKDATLAAEVFADWPLSVDLTEFRQRCAAMVNHYRAKAVHNG